jgi:murein DD-endopeptidase MepM/ murein hydrolase activator NlpD
MASCAGCTGCAGVAALLVLGIGGALLAATAQIAGIGLGGGSVCDLKRAAACASTTAAAAGEPMSCAGLYVSQGFGNTPWEHPHTGIDLVCPPETPVLAVADGIFHQKKGAQIACTFPPGRTGGLGVYGELDTGNETFLYGHLNGFAVADGAEVVAGQRLGYEGDTGCATGDHLHFELMVSGNAVDPCLVLPQGYPDVHDSTGLRCWGAALP